MMRNYSLDTNPSASTLAVDMKGDEISIAESRGWQQATTGNPWVVKYRTAKMAE
jgi:hypothetical protein